VPELEAPMSISEYPSIEYLRQCVREENGRLFWLERPESHFRRARDRDAWNARFAGKEAGCPMGKKCVRCQVMIDRNHFFRYVIIWAMYNNEWKSNIDHRNRDSLDDRIDNLRLATRNQQQYNQGIRSNNKSGFKGVSWVQKCQKWHASIQINGKSKNLGYFDDPAKASEAYLKAATDLHGEFFCNE
jgi:hypothetical protein